MLSILVMKKNAHHSRSKERRRITEHHDFPKKPHTGVRISPVFIVALTLLITFAVCLSPSIAAQVAIGWDVNTDDVAGYKLHYGTVSKTYDYTLDVGNYTSCTVSGLEEGVTYHFAATAYNSAGESGYSESISYTVPYLVQDQDTDGDGISDYDEINIYDTDPNDVDTDGDGIWDGEELAYWGDTWYSDNDGDGLYNLIDPDSDNDGIDDGTPPTPENPDDDNGGAGTSSTGICFIGHCLF